MTKGLAVLCLAALAAPQEFSAGSFKGKTPPELVSDKGQWLNSADALRLEKLNGKVVWLEFSFLN